VKFTLFLGRIIGTTALLPCCGRIGVVGRYVEKYLGRDIGILATTAMASMARHVVVIAHCLVNNNKSKNKILSRSFPGPVYSGYKKFSSTTVPYE